MNNRIVATLFFSLIFITGSLWGNNTMAENNYWQCTAYDSEEKQWIVKNAYERVAINKAFEACKKESRAPASCKATNESCDYFANGTNSNRPKVSVNMNRTFSDAMWQCTALDQMAKPWVGNPSSNKDDAALGAKAYCQQHSTVPDTCYINLLTCKNINGS